MIGSTVVAQGIPGNPVQRVGGAVQSGVRNVTQGTLQTVQQASQGTMRGVRQFANPQSGVYQGGTHRGGVLHQGQQYHSQPQYHGHQQSHGQWQSFTFCTAILVDVNSFT
ncbi:hypothetical protein [Neorhodopirellula pilleata]|nr:hypothetical protein [Neorhodopirellula pilleata]